MNCKVVWPQLQVIDIQPNEFEDENERELQAPATPSSEYISSLLDAMMDIMQVLMDVQEAFKAENQKFLVNVQ